MTMAWDAAWIGMRGMHCRCEHNTPFCWLCVCMFSVVFWGVASLLLCLCVSVVSVALLLISTHCFGERQVDVTPYSIIIILIVKNYRAHV